MNILSVDTLRWCGRWLIWPFIVLFEIVSDDSISDRYAGLAGVAIIPGVMFFVSAAVAALVPGWPFPSTLVNTIIFFSCAITYFVIGFIFYFEFPNSIPCLGKWQDNGPW